MVIKKTIVIIVCRCRKIKHLSNRYTACKTKYYSECTVIAVSDYYKEC